MAVVPCWALLVISVGATVFAWKTEILAVKRARAGMCGACGYDHSGLAGDAKCPECGKD